MAITQTIQGPSAIPNRVTDTPEQFSVNAIVSLTDQAAMGAQQNTYATQANALAVQVNADAATSGANAIIALDASAAAVGAANYKGSWEGKTGAGAIGESYLYKASFIYRLNVNLANLSASEPSPTNTDWVFIQEVPFEAPCKPTLDLDFANQDFTIYDKLGGFVKRPLADIVSQGRATAGGSTDAIGGVTEFGAGENRFTFDGETGEALGYLSEESRTNLLTYSEDFTNTAWTKSGLSVSAGALASSVLVENSSNSQHFIASSFSGSPSTTYTFTSYAKSNGRSVLCGVAHSGGGAQAAFNLSNGSVILTTPTGVNPMLNLSASIELVSDGFYRMVFVFSTPSDSTGGYSASLQLADATKPEPINVYQGDGVSGVFLRGAQLEAGSFPTSYIKTLGTVAMRAADSMTSTLGQKWNPNEGTFAVEFDDLKDVDDSVIFSTNDGTVDNSTKLYQTAAGFIALDSRVSGVVTTSIITSVNRSIGKIKCAIAISKSSASISINGGAATTVTLANALDLYSQSDIAHQLENNVSTVKIADLQYYPRAFDALTLQRLSRIQ